MAGRVSSWLGRKQQMYYLAASLLSIVSLDQSAGGSACCSTLTYSQKTAASEGGGEGSGGGDGDADCGGSISMTFISLAPACCKSIDLLRT